MTHPPVNMAPALAAPISSSCSEQVCRQADSYRARRHPRPGRTSHDQAATHAP
jgi:hypothetical protein